MHGSDKALPESAARERKLRPHCTTFISLTSLVLIADNCSKLLINPTSPATNEIGYELGIIKSNFGREIAALKCALSGDVSTRPRRHVSSSSLASMSSNRDAPSESIKSPAKWNERVQEISEFCDKFSTIIDDGKESDGASEIDNGTRRNYRASSGRAPSDVPQDESFN